MNTHDELSPLLSDYLDGELTDDEQRQVAAHLAECALCRDELAELEAVVRTASSMPQLEPATDLWQGISARLEPVTTRPATGGSWRFTFSLPQLAAASVALALLSGWAATRFLARESNVAPVSASVTPNNAADPSVSDNSVVPARFEDAEYDAAVVDLKEALEKGRGTLDPATVAVIEENLKTINQAVEEARKALAADPANGYLSGYLVNTQRRQLDLLRHAAALASGAD